MTDSLIHRGPDDSGYTFEEASHSQVGLGHRRLSILDLSPLGHQPMRFENYEIVFNGEIYNFLEVRKELEQLGYQFTSHADTEVILKGFHKWGIKVVDRFVGMFAFVIHDNANQKLFLVRDRVGVKPLFYYNQNDVLLFGSELKAFHAHPRFRKSINFSALTSYFQFGYIISPDTIFENTYQVQPGHYVEFNIKEGTLREKSYWQVEDFYQSKENLSQAEVLSEIERLLTSSANYRMVSDVPVGLFLSGGYDSSTIAAILQKDRTAKIKTFTIGFDEAGFDEAPHAKKVAEYLGTEHTEYYASLNDALALVPQMPEYFDQPFADYSSIPTMLVSELARKNVAVALSADGGDEVFGGYPKYLQALKYRKIRSFLPNMLARPIQHAYDLSSQALLNESLRSIKYKATSNKISELIKSQSVTDFARINVQQFEEKALEELLVTAKESRLNLFYDNRFFRPFDHLDRLLLLDLKIYLPDDLLVKIDRSTMRVSLEGREPLLDHRLIEFMGKVNAQSKVDYSRMTNKFYLKQIAHKYIPEQMLNRPKMGFTPPLAKWLRGPLREYVALYIDKKRIDSQGILNHRAIDRMKRDFYDLNYEKASKKLWNILMFQLWYEKWMH